MFSKAYDSTFPEIQIKVKTKTLLSPWIIQGIKKSSKKKQKLYKKLLKKQTYHSGRTYKNYKNSFWENQKLFQETAR